MRISLPILAFAAAMALPACQSADTASGSTMTPPAEAVPAATNVAIEPAATPPAGAVATPPAAGPMTDADFVMKAASGGMMEVEAAKQVQVKSTDPMVKSVADMILRDHTKANDELKALAATKRMQLPGAPMGDARMTLDKLMATNGKEFDRAYLEEMSTAHTKDIAMFQKEAAEGKDAEVRAFASRTLPKLQEHGAMIEKHRKMQ